MISIKQNLQNRFPSLSLAGGIRAALSPSSASFPDGKEAFPFVSLRGMLNSFKWPSSLHYEGNYPSNRELPWSNELNGVTNNGAYWFFAQKDRLWKIPATQKLGTATQSQNPDILYVDIPEQLSANDYNHFGDLACHNNWLFVPIESKNKASTGRIAIFSANTLEFVTSWPVYTDNNSLPWIGLNPLNSTILLSPFYSDPEHALVYIYGLQYNTLGVPVNTKLLRAMPLSDELGNPLCLSRIQGGTVTPSGHLYLVVDAPVIGTSGFLPTIVTPAGIMGFSLLDGRRRLAAAIDYDPTISTPWENYINEELEGITFWPVGSDVAPGIPNSQLHVAMISNAGTGVDDLYFKHFRAPSGEESAI